MTSPYDSWFASEVSLPKLEDKFSALEVNAKSPSDLSLSSQPSTLQGDEAYIDLDTDPAIRTHDFGFIPIPKRRRFNPAKPFHLTLPLTLIFAFVSTATGGNIYYCQPILLNLARTLGVTKGAASSVPTITQAGYATGLLLITPLGDLVRRRPLLLIIVTCSMLTTIAVALAPNLIGLQLLSFLLGILAITPQILLPFAGDLAPTEKRGSTLAIVLSGYMFGIVFARVFGGVIAQVTSWRVIYWGAAGLHLCSLLGLWWSLPDWPSKIELAGETQPGAKHRTTYAGILWSMAKLAVTEPILVQSSLMMAANEMQYSAFWVTLTFLLGGKPYQFSTLKIGLFGMVGAFGVLTAPLVGLLIDKLVLWVGMALAVLVLFAAEGLMTAGSTASIGVVVVGCWLVDAGCQLIQVSGATRIFGIDPALRSRLNAVFMISGFLGQFVGSGVNSHVFLTYGPRASYAVAMGWIGLMLIALLARGPHAKRYTWLGWEGGARLSKAAPTAPVEKDANMS